MTDLNR